MTPLSTPHKNFRWELLHDRGVIKAILDALENEGVDYKCVLVPDPSFPTPAAISQLFELLYHWYEPAV